MRKTSCILLLLLTFFSFLPQLVTAQEEDEATAAEKADEETLKGILQNFTTAYGKLTETKEIGSVMKYFSRELTSTLVSYDVGDHVRVLHNSYQDFADYLKKVVRAPGLGITYDVKDVLRVQVKGEIGVVVYVVNYAITRDGEKWSSGTETVTMTFKKQGSNWRIIHNTIIAVEDEKLKGTCSCEIYESGTGDYVAKTTVPNGSQYSTALKNFDFTLEGDVQVITVEGQAFVWDKERNVFAKDSEEKIGVAPNKEDVVLLIIKRKLYAGTCTRIRVKH